MVQHYLESLGPTLLVGAFFLILVLNWSRRRTWTRAIACGFTLAIALRYLWWRYVDTVLPYSDDDVTFYWVWFLFIVELLAFTEIFLFLVTMSRYADRSVEADRLEAASATWLEDDWPTVDVFIPTYDEPIDVLERTIVGALALDYPGHKLKVYVLDDKRRDWLRRYCEEKGSLYVTRPDNLHAKAGNMNHGLKVSSGDLVAVFDADFVPYRRFLRRTVPFFQDPTIGIVQTPQHFFNKDPIQSNLSVESLWPDEQRLFFDEMAASRDAWNVSFCCGSCSVLRRRALEEIGGIPTESITEDLLTTLAMLNKGFKTRYLNERLSMGLAAENLRGYFVQRSRWCRGGIQTLYARSGPIRGPGLSFFQRIMFIPLSWLVQYVVRFAILIVPPVYLWTGAAPLYFTDTLDIVYYQVPVLLSYFFLMQWITPSRYLPFLSTAVGAFSTFRLLPTVIATMIKPFGTPFKVTPKGSAAEQDAFDAYTFAWVAALTALTAAGVIVNLIPEWSPIRKGEFSVVALAWAAANIVVLVIAGLICFEKPRPSFDSFLIDEPADARFGAQVLPGHLTSLSLEHGTMEFEQEPPVAVGDELVVEAAGFPSMPSQVEKLARHQDGRLFIQFKSNLDPAARDHLIIKLYSGDYSQEIRKLDASAIAAGLWKRAFGRTATTV
ncbi:glycosyltransferase [Reyranella sp.]|uniref:glycosyltransferase n=1 Tax=Reyranella sp. TaxID=1929291 RepID=UPI003D12C80D